VSLVVVVVAIYFMNYHRCSELVLRYFDCLHLDNRVE
jgi:hypothetical protein